MPQWLKAFATKPEDFRSILVEPTPANYLPSRPKVWHLSTHIHRLTHKKYNVLYTLYNNKQLLEWP